jgi:hypothetical protein
MHFEVCFETKNIFEILEENGWGRIGGAHPTFTKLNCFLEFYPYDESPDFTSDQPTTADLIWVLRGRGVQKREKLAIFACHGDVLLTSHGQFNTKTMSWQA